MSTWHDVALDYWTVVLFLVSSKEANIVLFCRKTRSRKAPRLAIWRLRKLRKKKLILMMMVISRLQFSCPIVLSYISLASCFEVNNYAPFSQYHRRKVQVLLEVMPRHPRLRNLKMKIWKISRYAIYLGWYSVVINLLIVLWLGEGG